MPSITDPETGRFLRVPLTIERLKANCTIDPLTGCWNWSGNHHKRMGYGKVTSVRKTYLVHRVMWRLVFGEPAPGVKVLHKCDNGRCCNPDHLKTGTQQDNITDCVSKGRNAFGEKQHLSKLTKEVALEISRSKESADSAAKRLGVTRGTIYHIRNGRIWKQITGLSYGAIKG